LEARSVELVGLVLAHLQAKVDRLPAAKRTLAELASDDFATLPFDAEWLYGLSLLAETCGIVGEAEPAAVLYGLLLPWAALNVADIAEGMRGSVSRYLELLATQLHRWSDAERHFEDGLELNARMGLGPWLAHTQHDYARMLLARQEPGDGERAEQLLAQAVSLYRELGMRTHADEAVR
jgi:hypothetical protein